MKRVLSLILALVLILSLCPSAFAAGNEDLSKLTYKELLALQSDISAEFKANHTPTEAQTKFVLSETQTETKKYYVKKGLQIVDWAWYDREYTYTKDWDFYTLSTHLDYKTGSKSSSKQAKIYSELYYKGGKFVLTYLKTDNTVILDNRAEYKDILWFTEPKPRINKETNIDLSKYTEKELTALYKKAENQIASTHSVNDSERNTILGYTQLELEQYLLEKNYELRGYAWYDSEYTYIRDWDYYWLETHVDYRNSSGTSKTDKLFSEFAKINGELELVYLKMGSSVVMDRRGELASYSDNGIPRYAWAGSEVVRSVANETEEEQPIAETDTETADADTSAEVPASSGNGEGIYLSFDTATDEELEEAIQKIKAEQRARLKTKIVLSEESITIAKGKTVKLTAEVVDVPEDLKASRITWSTSDKNIATYQNGVVGGRGNGEATITAACTLSDGTEIYNECIVTVYTAVNSIQSASRKTIDLGVGESTTIEITVQPKDATNPAIKWESSDDSVASVNNGVITGTGVGTATITATTVDGSEKQLAFTVKATKKDDMGKTITNSDGVALTVLNMKQTKGSDWAAAEDGNIFVLIELQIENNTTDEISINSTFGFNAYCDDYSVDYSFSADLNTNNDLSSTDLKPGRKIKGWKGFEVPKDWKELIVEFTPDASMWGSGEKIEFVIYNN